MLDGLASYLSKQPASRTGDDDFRATRPSLI